MKILLDENLPRKLVAALRAEGHEVESIHTLRLQGLENGKLYEFARDSFDLCFTRDAGFANNVRQGAAFAVEIATSDCATKTTGSICAGFYCSFPRK